MDLPLFPLHTVLCPGVALPLQVFEDRYKAMVDRCLAERSPFGVVLIREGREVGPGELAVAAVGTVAEIREATRYRDGRYDLLTLGTQRFRLEAVDPAAEQYLVGQITPLHEVLGEAARAKRLGERVVQLFIQYLELLRMDESSQGRGRTDRTPDEPALSPLASEAGTSAGARLAADESDDAPAFEATELARLLTIPEDPTVLSYLMTGIVQVESVRRQGLLEMPTTELRLVELAHLLEREIALLGRGLGTYTPDPRLAALRRN